MTDSWSNSEAAPPSAFGTDLHLALSGPGLRAGLIDALRDAVRTGRLAPGSCSVLGADGERGCL
jgi:GntR family transcriptional regulator/MocR family aminotransferase